MSLTFGVGVSDGSEDAREPRHTIATGMVTGVFGVSSARCVTSFIYVLLCHGTRQVCDHMIMSFDIIIE